MTLYIYPIEYKEGSKRRRRRVKNNRIYTRGGLMNINTSIFYINEFIYTHTHSVREWVGKRERVCEMVMGVYITCARMQLIDTLSH